MRVLTEEEMRSRWSCSDEIPLAPVRKPRRRDCSIKSDIASKNSQLITRLLAAFNLSNNFNKREELSRT